MPSTDEPLEYVAEEPVDGPHMFCFLESTRVCGADCMAFVTHPRSSSASELSDAQNRCAVLSGIERTGRHVTIIAGLLTDTSKHQKAVEADKKRAASTPQPTPFTTK